MTIFAQTFLAALAALWLRDWVRSVLAYVRKHNAECKMHAAEFIVRMREASDAEDHAMAKTYEEQYRFYSKESPFKFLGWLCDRFQLSSEAEDDPEQLAQQWRALLEIEKCDYKSEFQDWQRRNAGGKPYREWTSQEKERWAAEVEMFGLERVHEAGRTFTKDMELADLRKRWLAAGEYCKWLATEEELNSWSEGKSSEPMQGFEAN